MKKNLTKTKRLALTGILAAAALALSFAEKFLIAALPLPMGVKPGFSNIIVMFTCGSLGLLPALAIAAVKAFFSALLSGWISGLISFCGGILSVLTMYTAIRLTKGRLSYTGISVLSSCMHNMGQLTAASAISGTFLFTGYAPVLIVSGVIFGAVTGTVMNIILPHLNRLDI